MGDQGGELERGIPLAELVAELRRQLVVAMQQAQGEAVRFALGDVELELSVGVTRERSGSGGIQFWVFSLGGAASRAENATHVIRLKLHPESVSGDEVRISGSSPERPR